MNHIIIEKQYTKMQKPGENFSNTNKRGKNLHETSEHEVAPDIGGCCSPLA